MSTPSISTEPDVGSTIRLIIRRMVVLPDPEEPTSTVTWRAGITRSSPETASVDSPKRLVTERNSIMGFSGGAGTGEVPSERRGPGGHRSLDVARTAGRGAG